MPERLREVRLATTAPRTEAQGRALEGARQYAEAVGRGSGAWMLLCGPTGAGKSHVAAALVAEVALARPRLRVAMCFVPEWLERLRASQHDPASDVLWRAERARLLVLDDLATERPTDWALEQTSRLVHARWSASRPTVVTTNLSPALLAERTSAPALRRILEASEWRFRL